MGLAQLKTKPYISVEQYLEWERPAEERSEYIDGEIFAMAGESDAHGDISMNLATTLGNQLKDTPCRGRIKDTKVRSGTLAARFGRGMVSYPDMVVICGEVEYHDEHKDVILNPKVIFEILSDSTEQFDRGAKFQRFRTFNDTLTDYILISQTEPYVEHYLRRDNGEWLMREFVGIDSSFAVESINCKVSLSDLYDRIEFA